MKHFLFCLASIAALVANAQSVPMAFHSGTNQTALLELYTSEGCDSCPPAEAWLSGLKESPGLWTSFVPVAFHVDYWDNLGWRDPWGTRAYSDRQRAYAQNWHSESIYTPGFVLDGKEWRDWLGRKGGPKSAGKTAGVLAASSSDTNHWHLRFAPVHANDADFEAHAAILACGLSSDVKAGENRGRLLKHDFAVLTLVDTPLVRSGDMVQGDLVLPVARIIPGGSLALAVWVTQAGRLEPAKPLAGGLFHPFPSTNGGLGYNYCKVARYRATNRGMKKLSLFLFALALALPAMSQPGKTLLNLDKTGVAIQGYDPVAFFTDNKPVKGNPAFPARQDGALYYFASQEHLDLFKKEPAKYEPAYGGYCAYGVSRDKLVEIDVDAFQIVNGRLLLQYSKGVRDDFNKDTNGNLAKAQQNWPELVQKKGK